MLNAARPASVAGFGDLERITACAICTQCDPTIAPTLSGAGLAPARNCIFGVIMLINSHVSLFTHAGYVRAAIDSPRRTFHFPMSAAVIERTGIVLKNGIS
jgi:hypothetical protein